MNLSRLPNLLARIAEIFERSGAKRQADNIRALQEVLAEEIEHSGDEALAVAQSRLAASARSKKKTSYDSVPATVHDYVNRLESLAVRADLDGLSEFKASAFKKSDLDRIAHLYAKGPSRYKTKTEAIRQIENRFFERARAKRELEYLEKNKVTPW
jgi:hypothetical protein